MADDDFDDGLVEGALPPETHEKAEPVALNELLPWHTPRKWFIRRHQWGLWASRLISKLRNRSSLQPGGDALTKVRYLCLPGRDYLDVEEISEICTSYGLELEVTGFHDAYARLPEMARAEMRQQALVEGKKISNRSETYWSKIEDFVQNKGTVKRQIEERGPFDIINLDACGSIRPHSARRRSLTKTLQSLISFQLHRSNTPWLLFVTVNVNIETLHPDVLAGFSEAIKTNANESEEFKAGVERLFESEHSLEDGMSAQMEKDGYELVRFFFLGLSKWLIHLTRESGWTVKTFRSYCYSTTQRHDENIRLPSMPSLAFEFQPPPLTNLTDPFSVTERIDDLPLVQSNSGDKAICPSIRALNEAYRFENLDRKLAEDDELRNSLRRDVISDLRRIGYKLSEHALSHI